METKQVIAEMLKENTGRHFLDSGGAYGRHWETNQKREFDSEPESVAEFSLYGGGVEILVTHNLYHWLSERLIYDPLMQKRFDKFADRPENEDKHWLQLMEEFPQTLAGAFGDVNIGGSCVVGGIYGEGEPITVNTYNGEDLLSQTIQYTFFSIRLDLYHVEDGEMVGPPLTGAGDYVLLQIHGGCDVRGGYTAPKAFRVNDNYGETAIFDNARAVIQCQNNHDHYWYTDDGCHWYDNGCCGNGYKQLESYDAIELEEEPNAALYHPDLFEKGDTPTEYEHAGTVVVYDKRGFCPICGGELLPLFY